jgi:outer membrane scaffolding protein for murein synthesis (MipA/OmpV family)
MSDNVMYRNLFIFFFIGLAYIVLEGSATAGSAQKQDNYYVQDGDWSFILGALGVYKPEYEGSDDYEVRIFPVINITWQNTFFLNPREGLGAFFWNRNNVKLGLSIGYTFGRDEDDSSHLDGLGDVDGGINANVLLKWKVEDVALDARYEQQLTGEDTGFQVHLGLGYNLQTANKIMIKPSIKTIYASSEYMDEYFGISSSQSARSGLSEYDADSGFKSIGFQVMANYRVNQHWGIQAIVGFDHMVGGAAKSPVVKAERQCLLGVGLSRRF